MLVLLVIPVFSTLLGGLLAIWLRSSLQVLIAVGAGLLLGAATLDLLPEAIGLSMPEHGISDVLLITLLSFAAFLALQQGLNAAAVRWGFSPRAMRRVGGALLIFHSLRDGMAIGLSYAASHPAGYAVAAGIAAHDLGDGMNTILLTTRGERPGRTAYTFLALDSLAPLLGGLMTVYWKFSARGSVVLLAIAAGFFLQMALGDFLPEVLQVRGQRAMVVTGVAAGIALIYAANLLLGGWA